MNNKISWHTTLLPMSIMLSIIFLITYFSLSAAGFLVGSEPNIAIGGVSRWCERVNQNILREPINALSNIGFMIAAIFMIRSIIQDQKRNNDPNKYHGFSALILLYIGGTYFLGPGSMFMHGTHTEWGQWIDNLSMVMYIIIPWLINLKEMAGWSTRTLFVIYLSLAFIYAVTSWVYDSEMGINLDLWALSIGLWIISEALFRFWSAQFRVISGLIGFLVAAVFGISPIEIITNIHNYWWIILFWIPAIFAKQPPKNQRTYNPWFFGGMAFFVIAFYIWGQGKPGSSWCNPDSFLQFHGVWHLMCAVATWCFFKFLRTEVPK